MNEFYYQCAKCKKTGNALFARMHYKQIAGMWLHLCSKCWEKQNNNQK